MLKNIKERAQRKMSAVPMSKESVNDASAIVASGQVPWLVFDENGSRVLTTGELAERFRVKIEDVKQLALAFGEHKG